MPPSPHHHQHQVGQDTPNDNTDALLLPSSTPAQQEEGILIMSTLGVRGAMGLSQGKDGVPILAQEVVYETVRIVVRISPERC